LLCRPKDPVHEEPSCDQEQDDGPVIQFGGVTARWTGSSYSNRNGVGIEARVNFETYASERTMSCLEIGNSGTTVVYFNWKVFLKTHVRDTMSIKIHIFAIYFILISHKLGRNVTERDILSMYNYAVL